MEELIRNLDIPGKSFNFNINGGNYKTLPGGVLTILITASYVITTYYFGKDLIYFESPTVVEEKAVLRNVPQVNLRNFLKNLTIGVKSDIKTIERYYIPRFYVYKKGNESDFTYTRLSWKNKNCTEESFDNNYFDNGIIKERYDCFTYGGVLGDFQLEDSNEELYDSSTNNDNRRGKKNSTILFAGLEKCDREYEIEANITCATENEYGLFNGTQLQFFLLLSNSYFYHKSYSYPMHDFMMLPFIDRISLGVEISYKYYSYNIVEVSSDKGFVSEMLEKNYFLQFDKQEMPIKISKEENRLNFIYGSAIKLGNIYSIYHRTYLKFPSLIADVGGFMGLIVSGVTLIYNFFLENSYISFMISKIFNLKYIETEIDLKFLELTQKNKGVSMGEGEKAGIELEQYLPNLQNLAEPEINLPNKDDKDSKKNNDKNFENSIAEKYFYANIQPLKADNSIIEKEFRNGIGNDSKDQLFELRSRETKDLSHVNIKESKSISYKPKDFKHNVITVKNKFEEENLNAILENKIKLNSGVEVKINSLRRLRYYLCCFNHQENLKSKIKYEMMLLAENVLEGKSEILNLFKMIDQFRLLKKLLLNENQCFMLEERKPQHLYHLNSKKDGPLREVKEEIRKTKIEKLQKYLDIDLTKGDRSILDKLLINYLDPQLKTELGLKI